MESIKTEKKCHYCGKPGDDCNVCQEIFSKLCGRCVNVRGECDTKACQTFKEVKKDLEEENYKKRLFEKCQALKAALSFILNNVKLNESDKNEIDFDILTNNQEIAELSRSAREPIKKITSSIEAGKKIIVVPEELRDFFGTFLIEGNPSPRDPQETLEPWELPF